MRPPRSVASSESPIRLNQALRLPTQRPSSQKKMMVMVATRKMGRLRINEASIASIFCVVGCTRVEMSISSLSRFCT